MSQDDKRNKSPILVGKDFSEDETTQLDLSVEDLRERARRRSAEATEAPPRTPYDDPGVATEVLLERPSFEDDDNDDKEPVTANRVVPLGAGAARLIGSSSGPAAKVTLSDDDDDDDETIQLTRPTFSGGRALPADTGSALADDDPSRPKIRSLEEVHARLADDAADDATLSRPKIQRMTVSPGATAPAGKSRGPENTDTRKRAAATSSPPPDVDEQRLGTLVIEAPADATVYVDGEERGHGTIELPKVDRHRRFAVRVHRPGCRPWSRAVTLGGRDEYRVTATPEPR